MTKNEYLTRLTQELKRNKIPDAEEICMEYEQHFAFKLADGYSEEEIAAKLGSPQRIASQFQRDISQESPGAEGRIFIKLAMSFVALFEAVIFLLFYCWILVVAAASLVSVAIGVCLIGQLNISGLLPQMPYASAVVFGVSFLALAVILAVASYYFFVYIKQFVKASIRWYKSITSSTVLPPLSWYPKLSDHTRRTLRTMLVWSSAVFGVSFVLALILSVLHSGSLEFWHAWNWFVS